MWVRAIIVRKDKWKPLELPLSKKIVNQNQYVFLEELQKYTAT